MTVGARFKISEICFLIPVMTPLNLTAHAVSTFGGRDRELSDTVQAAHPLRMVGGINILIIDRFWEVWISVFKFYRIYIQPFSQQYHEFANWTVKQKCLRPSRLCWPLTFCDWCYLWMRAGSQRRWMTDWYHQSMPAPRINKRDFLKPALSRLCFFLNKLTKAQPGSVLFFLALGFAHVIVCRCTREHTEEYNFPLSRVTACLLI